MLQVTPQPWALDFLLSNLGLMIERGMTTENHRMRVDGWRRNREIRALMGGDESSIQQHYARG
jgi:hypothetical protein